jgi:hypothetical protein
MAEINFNPYTAESEAIARRLRMAEALNQQSMTPLEQPQVAGVKVSPYSGLAKLLQAGTAAYMQSQGQAQQEELGKRYAADTGADFQSMIKALSAPAQAAVPEGAPTYTPNIGSGELADNARMTMQPERNELGEIIAAGEPGAGNFGVTPGAPAQAAIAAGRLTPEGFGAMKTPMGQQQYMAQLLGQMKPREPIKLGKDDVLYDPVSGKTIYKPEATAPNLSFQRTGSAIQGFDPRTGVAVGPSTPINISPDTAATLKQTREISDRAFNQLSTQQKAQLANEAARLNISAQQLFFDTGIETGGGARLPSVTPSAATPTGGPAVPAAMPAALAGPVVARPAPAAPVTAVTATTSANAPVALSPRARQELEKSRQLEEFKGMTETQSNAALFGGAMNQAQSVITELEGKGTVKNAVIPSMLQSVAKLVPFGPGEQAAAIIESVAKTDPTSLFGPDQNQQRLGQAQIAFATAWLRKTSGAAFGGSEIANTIKEYFPLIGEGDAVIKQKADSRNRAIEGLRLSTGAQGKSYIDKYGGTPTSGASNDPFGLRKK